MTVKSDHIEQNLLVITRPVPTVNKSRRKASGERSIENVVKKGGKAVAAYLYLNPEDLQAELSKFLDTFGSIVNKLPSKVSEFSVDSIEVSVEITAKGSVGLLGTGGEVGGTGGLKFIFKRR